MNSAANRPVGVMMPQNQISAGRGGPRTLSGFAEAKSYGIEYTDDDGNKHTTIGMYIGGQWYLPPNGENYASTLRPLKSDTWLAKSLEERRESDGGSVAGGGVPGQDNVDVVGG